MPAKKVFDITPPRKRLQEEPYSKPEQKLVLRPASSKKRRLTLFFVGLSLLLGGILSYFLITPKANLEIWPKKESAEETTVVLVAPIQRESSYVPGEILEIEKIVSQNFTVQSTKLKATKAQGIIRVYNNYSTSPQILVATTRFVSDDGKLFRTPERVIIPGGRQEGGKLVSGFVDIKVVADQPGEEYNINPSTFSIPGFAGTVKYTAFYAKSSEPMTGGIKEEVPQVTQQDLDKAKEILADKALAESSIALKDSASSKQYIIIDEAISSKAVDFQSSAEVGEEAGSFSAQTKAVSKAVVFRESELNNFSRNYMQEKIPSGGKLIESSLKIEYLLEAVNLEKNELTLKLKISAQSHSAPEEIQIKEAVKNKSLNDIKNTLKNIPQIEKTRVELWPFWVSFSPEDSAKINIILRGVD